MGRLVSVANLEIQDKDMSNILSYVKSLRLREYFSKKMLTCPMKTFCSLDPSGTPSAENKIIFPS